MALNLSMDKGLGRMEYIGLGALLFGIKVALDFAVARIFGRPYSILGYVRAADSPLLRPAESPGYWIAMWAVALPFIAAGLVLTIRRLRDAGVPAWLTLLFFIPFANIMFFGICALVPQSRTAARALVRRSTERHVSPVGAPRRRQVRWGPASASPR